MLRSITSAVIAFIVFLVIHFSYFHYFRPYEKSKTVFIIFFICLLVYWVLIKYLPNEEWFLGKLNIGEPLMKRYGFPILGILFYGFLFLGYLEFYFTADRSITFRMLMVVDSQPNKMITRDKMFDIYNVPRIIDKRFEDLTYGGYLYQADGGYRLTTKGQIILNVYRWSIDFLRLESGQKSP